MASKKNTRTEELRVIREYLQKVSNRLHREHSEKTFRTDFENFISNLNDSYRVDQEIAEAKIGTPDFKAFTNQKKIGYIETKVVSPLHPRGRLRSGAQPRAAGGVRLPVPAHHREGVRAGALGAAESGGSWSVRRGLLPLFLKKAR